MNILISKSTYDLFQDQLKNFTVVTENAKTATVNPEITINGTPFPLILKQSFHLIKPDKKAYSPHSAVRQLTNITLHLIILQELHRKYGMDEDIFDNIEQDGKKTELLDFSNVKALIAYYDFPQYFRILEESVSTSVKLSVLMYHNQKIKEMFEESEKYLFRRAEMGGKVFIEKSSAILEDYEEHERFVLEMAGKWM